MLLILQSIHFQKNGSIDQIIWQDEINITVRITAAKSAKLKLAGGRPAHRRGALSEGARRC